ncbi:MAG TPA: adenylate/guanylate cyclase domain-containing protein [Acidimicrobiales bacterium]
MGDVSTQTQGPVTACAPLTPDEECELRQWLRSVGADENALELANGDPSRVAVDVALRQGECLSARHIAERHGVEPKRIASVFQMAGVAVPDVDHVRFTEHDAEFVHVVEAAGLLDAADGRALMRAVATALDRVAEAAVAFYVQGTEARLEKEHEKPIPWAMETARMTALAGKLGDGMGLLFRHHLRQAIDRQRISQQQVTSRDVARMAVGFVDLVGSTALAQTLDVGELRKVVSTFESRAFEVAVEHGGRVVKFIGDEIMVATIDPAAACRLMLALVDECSIGGLEPRGGLAYGELLFRGGDYYGPEVNLASRLVDTAVPGEVLVDRSIVEAVRALDPDADSTGHALGCPSRLEFDPGGRRVLKGFADPVTVWTLRCGGAAAI